VFIYPGKKKSLPISQAPNNNVILVIRTHQIGHCSPELWCNLSPFIKNWKLK